MNKNRIIKTFLIALTIIITAIAASIIIPRPFLLQIQRNYPGTTKISRIDYQTEIAEGFFCLGPDKYGNPTSRITEINSKDVKNLYYCSLVETENPTLLDSAWFFDDHPAFAGGPSIEINHSGYEYFSLLEAFNYSSTRDWLRGEHLELDDLPEGEYTIIIFINRKVIKQDEIIIFRSE